MKAVAIDYGAKRVGIALGEDGMLSYAKTLDVTSDTDAMEKIKALLAHEAVHAMAFGLPVRLDGSEQKEAKKVRSIAMKLSSSLGIAAVFIDERLTTVEAESMLREQGLSEREMRGKLDATVAKLLLAQYYRDIQQ